MRGCRRRLPRVRHRLFGPAAGGGGSAGRCGRDRGLGRRADVKTAARTVLAGWLAVAVLAPWLAPNDPGVHFDARAYAPPTRVHVRNASGALAAPFLYAQILGDDPLQRRHLDDESRPVALRWFQN